MSKEKNLFLKLIPVLVTVIIMVIVAVMFMRTAERQRRLALIAKEQRGDVEIKQEQPEAVSEEIDEPAEIARIADQVVLSPQNREMPGKVAATVLIYKNNTATNVLISGSWDHWATKIPLEKKNRQWLWDFRDLGITEGFYEFKFIPDMQYESGVNRTLYINEAGYAERPLDLIVSAKIEKMDRVDLLLAHTIENPDKISVKFVPEIAIKATKWITSNLSKNKIGYSIKGNDVTFYMDESVYGISIPSDSSVVVAGTFNNWTSDKKWALRDDDNDNVWIGTFSIPGGGEDAQFKFIVGGSSWLSVADSMANAVHDGRGHVNLSIKSELSEKPTLQIFTKEPIDLSRSYTVVIENMALREVIAAVMPGAVLDSFKTEKPLGAIVSDRHNSTLFRVFAPRAKSVDLCLYDTPEFSSGGTAMVAKITVPMKMVPNERYWSAKVKGKLYGQYYSFRVDGPNGRGEGFNIKTRVGDPYARAAAYAVNNTILIDEKATNKWFTGWTDDDFEPIAWEDTIIYETHVRDLTMDKSSPVPDDVRGKFAGIIASEGTGTGIDHLRELGVNMIEFMPVAEFYNGTNEHGWGYNTSYFFAPESSYGQDPLKGSQYYEFKTLVNYLHEQGFGVILDVVYNHVGSPNVFSMLDRFYYFRIGSDFSPLNFSGCGNDVKTEAPMMRKLIIENILYWMREFHIDGFRFDLAELIDMETLMELRDAARKENPNVLLISEPWSFRGDHKLLLKGKEWASWNNDFRDTVRYFVLGHGDRNKLKEVIQGTVSTWAANPMQSVNYLESHDDMAFADEITSNKKHDGSILVESDAIRNNLAATVLFTSLGIPMLGEGQEFIRSKNGIKNTYNKGDEVNALRWGDRERPIANATMEYYKGLIALRKDPVSVSLRLRDKAPDGYYEWLMPENKQAIGYFINKKKEVKGASFLVLLNASEKPAHFSVNFTEGVWRMIGDSKVIVPTGIRDVKIPRGGSRGSKISLPPLSSYIFMHI